MILGTDYRKIPRWKYQLSETVHIQTGIRRLDIECGWMDISGGRLGIYDGYAWDGPSGPTWDTENFMRGSLAHDALYQMIREGHLDAGYRLQVDKLLRQICLEDGMSKLRAWWVYRGVRLFGWRAIRPRGG